MLKNKYSLSKNVNFIFVSGKTFFTQTEKNLFMHTLDLLSFLSKIGASFENSTIPSNIGVEEEEFSIIINELLEYGVIEEGVMSREDDEDKNLYDTLRILKFRKKNVFLDYEDSKLTILKKEKLTREYEKDTKKTLYQDQNEFWHILPIPGYSSANSLVDQLSNLLYFTNGTVSDARAYSRYNVSLKPTPSNGACHPVVIFIQLFNVNGLNGVYRYISNSHSLKKHPLRIRNKSKNKSNWTA